MSGRLVVLLVGWPVGRSYKDGKLHFQSPFGALVIFVDSQEVLELPCAKITKGLGMGSAYSIKQVRIDPVWIKLRIIFLIVITYL